MRNYNQILHICSSRRDKTIYNWDEADITDINTYCSSICRQSYENFSRFLSFFNVDRYIYSKQTYLYRGLDTKHSGESRGGA